MGSIKLTSTMRTFIIISLLIVITNAQFFGRFNSGGGRVTGGRGAGRFGGQRLFGGQGIFGGQGLFGSNSRPNRGQNRNPGNVGGGSNNQGCIGSSCNQINFNSGGGGGNNNQGCIGSSCNQINFNTGGGISFGSGSNNNQGCTGGSNCNQINFG